MLKKNIVKISLLFCQKKVDLELHLNDIYNLFFGIGKTLRGQKVYKIDKHTKDALKRYVNETLMFFEHNELIKLGK